ncbi:hypothetical protein BDV93DRAFT_519786 [Ceratobasidium sp. AG-I]|nr:hypothetical protein BDV93DRAFT_519786 [Ceratobasidium sp. AG-I]
MADLANVLDELSFRSSKTAQLAALEQLHAALAEVCVGSDEQRLAVFLARQNDFETNIASRVLNSGIVSASTVLRVVEEIRASDPRARREGGRVSIIADVTALALSVLQGMALIHPRSKAFLGRKLGIQTLLDLLTALRHASANPDDPDATVLPGIQPPDAGLATSLSPLACSVIDTLLCLLVDSPTALRVFEQCNGLEVIVRTLKKVIGQNVRMKCLEFLYFYLQDEEVLAITGTPVLNLPTKSSQSRSRSASAPKPPNPTSTPARTPQTPRRPRAHQTPATDARPRTRPTPLSRTVSATSSVSLSSTDAGVEGRVRSASRSSVASQSSVRSVSTTSQRTQTDTDADTDAEQNQNRDRDRRFPRTPMPVMPSLSYSSSTISSTSTSTTSQPVTDRKPGASLSEECYVPLPESPTKKPQRREGDVRVERGAEETPRASKVKRSVFPKEGEGETPSRGLPLFPAPASDTFSTRDDRGPFGKREDVFGKRTPSGRARPSAPAPLELGLLTGEIDYMPVSPKKVRDKSKSNTPEPKSTAPEPEPTPEPKVPATPKPPKHRPRASEILPRPTFVKVGVRNVSTPSTPGTPVDGSMPVSGASTTITSSTPPVVSVTSSTGASTPPTTLLTPTPDVATPIRAKRAVIPGGTRTPGRPADVLRKSVVGKDGKEGLRTSQLSSSEGLRRSQLSSEGLRSPASSDGLRRSQVSSEGLRRSQTAGEGQGEGEAARLKKSSSAMNVAGAVRKSASPAAKEVGKKIIGSKVAGDGVRRVKESEQRSSIELDRKGSSEAGGRSSIETDRRPSTETDKRPSIELDAPLRASVIGEGTGDAGEKVVRSSAEKKELLSAWLGNVDALVEGVQRAGVWGLR